MMNAILISLSLMTLAGTSPVGQHSDLEQINQVVHQFSEAADQRNIKKIEAIMHTEFRSVVNQLFGSKDLSVMDRNVYLDLMKQEKIGGDERQVQIQSIDLQGNNAVVKVVLTGKILRFDTYMQLIKDGDGKWWVVSDMPSITKL